MRTISQTNKSRPFRTLLSRLLFLYCNTACTETGKTPFQLLLPKKVNTRLIIFHSNKGRTQVFTVANLKKFRILYPGDQIGSYRKGNKCVKGALVRKTGMIMYNVKYENYTQYKHIDQ